MKIELECLKDYYDNDGIHHRARKYLVDAEDVAVKKGFYKLPEGMDAPKPVEKPPAPEPVKAAPAPPQPSTPAPKPASKLSEAEAKAEIERLKKENKELAAK